MSGIVHPPFPSAVGHPRPQQSKPLINVYFRAPPAQPVDQRMHGKAYRAERAETTDRCRPPRSSFLADRNASSTTSLRTAVYRGGTASSKSRSLQRQVLLSGAFGGSRRKGSAFAAVCGGMGHEMGRAGETSKHAPIVDTRAPSLDSVARAVNLMRPMAGRGRRGALLEGSGEYPCSTSIVSPPLASPRSRNVEVTLFVRLSAEPSLNQVISSPRLVNKPALSLAFWCVPPT